MTKMTTKTQTKYLKHPTYAIFLKSWRVTHSKYDDRHLVIYGYPFPVIQTFLQGRVYHGFGIFLLWFRILMWYCDRFWRPSTFFVTSQSIQVSPYCNSLGKPFKVSNGKRPPSHSSLVKSRLDFGSPSCHCLFVTMPEWPRTKNGCWLRPIYQSHCKMHFQDQTRPEERGIIGP